MHTKARRIALRVQHPPSVYLEYEHLQTGSRRLRVVKLTRVCADLDRLTDKVIQALPENTIPGSFSREQLKTLLAQLWQESSQNSSLSTSAPIVPSSLSPSPNSFVISSQQISRGSPGGVSKRVQQTDEPGTVAPSQQHGTASWGGMARRQQPCLTSNTRTVTQDSNVQQVTGPARTSNQQRGSSNAHDTSPTHCLPLPQHHQQCQNKLTSDQGKTGSSSSSQLSQLHCAATMQQTAVSAPADQGVPSTLAAQGPYVSHQQLPGSESSENNSILQPPNQCLLQQLQVVNMDSTMHTSSSNSSSCCGASTRQSAQVSCNNDPSDAGAIVIALQGSNGHQHAVNNSSNHAACGVGSDDCLTLELDYLQPHDGDRTIDLNKASDYELQLAKAQMETRFLSNLLRPGDPGYEYDKQVQFTPTLANDWDEDD